MIKHVTEYYESCDGIIFLNEYKCLMHEMNVLYRKSGVKMYDKDKKVIEILDSDNDYNNCEYVMIDRSKESENIEFAYAVNNICGWCLISDAIKMHGGSMYHLYMNSLKELDIKEIES